MLTMILNVIVLCLNSICGAHFDGYASNAATTIVVGEGPVAGRKADVILAAQNAFQAAMR